MPRPRTVYRGKRKYGWIISLVVTLLVIALLLGVWLFYYLQRFLVYDKEGLRLDLSAREGLLSNVEAEEPVRTPAAVSPVDAEIVVEQRDYSGVQTSAGTDVRPLHAVFVSGENLNENILKYYSTSMGSFDALVVELKTEDGFLCWRSGVSAADSFAVNGSAEIAGGVAALKEHGVYLVAQLSALSDAAMAQRNAPLALKNSASGAAFTDGDGRYYLDPYNDSTRAYLLALMTELKTMGFDEILFTGFVCPDSPYLQFSLARTQLPTPTEAISSLSLWLREQADELGLKISVQVERSSLSAEETKNGQSAPLLFRIFDRVAVEADYASLPGDLSALTAALGSQDTQRIVPITVNFTPDCQSYIVR